MAGVAAGGIGGSGSSGAGKVAAAGTSGPGQTTAAAVAAGTSRAGGASGWVAGEVAGTSGGSGGGGGGGGGDGGSRGVDGGTGKGKGQMEQDDKWNSKIDTGIRVRGVSGGGGGGGGGREGAGGGSGGGGGGDEGDRNEQEVDKEAGRVAGVDGVPSSTLADAGAALGGVVFRHGNYLDQVGQGGMCFFFYPNSLCSIPKFQPIMLELCQIMPKSADLIPRNCPQFPALCRNSRFAYHAECDAGIFRLALGPGPGGG